jgi:RNA polymerase sigma factor (sigma-70 family)
VVFGKSVRVDGLQVWTVAELGAFYTEHRSELHTHASRLLRSSAKAEEVVQEALIKVMLAAPELSSNEHALSYMHRTIENLCIDIFRLEGRRPNLVVLDDATFENEATWQENIDHADIVATADDAAIVRQALSMLSPAERAALVMWEMEGRSTKEIANELGIKESTVRHTVSRARASLRRILSELIIDEERGLTALDLLSTTYKKASDVAKKSSKAALSLILVFFAFLGFNAMPNHENLVSLDVVNTSPESTKSELNVPGQTEVTNEPSPIATVESKSSKQFGTISAKPATLTFPGLDKDGVPTAFTITDTSGSLGVLYVTKSAPKPTEDGITLSVVSKTKSGAANIFLSQDISVDGNGTTYRTGISAGMNGSWVPLNLSQTSVDIERLASGNYIVTAIMMVDSAVETPITVPSSANGTDLVSAPKSVVTRLLLSASKTQILAQAVLVNESGKVGKA